MLSYVMLKLKIAYCKQFNFGSLNMLLLTLGLGRVLSKEHSCNCYVQKWTYCCTKHKKL